MSRFGIVVFAFVLSALVAPAYGVEDCPVVDFVEEVKTAVGSGRVRAAKETSNVSSQKTTKVVRRKSSEMPVVSESKSAVSARSEDATAVHCTKDSCQNFVDRMYEFFSLVYGNARFYARSYVPLKGLDDINAPEKAVVAELRTRNKNVKRLDKRQSAATNEEVEGGTHWVFVHPDLPHIVVRIFRPDRVDESLIPLMTAREVGTSHFFHDLGLPVVVSNATPDQLLKGITTAENIDNMIQLTDISPKRLPSKQRQVLQEKLDEIEKTIKDNEDGIAAVFSEVPNGDGYRIVIKQQSKKKVSGKFWWKKYETVEKEVKVDYHAGQLVLQKITQEEYDKLLPRDQKWVVELSLPGNGGLKKAAAAVGKLVGKHPKPALYRIRLIDSV